MFEIEMTETVTYRHAYTMAELRELLPDLPDDLTPDALWEMISASNADQLNDDLIERHFYCCNDRTWEVRREEVAG